MKSFLLPFCFLLMLSSWSAAEATAAPSVTMTPASDTMYVVQGTDFSGASGIDITIRYDAAALADPVVEQGSLAGGALMAVNASTPGMVRLALVRVAEINGSGAIATVAFTRLKSTGADIRSLNSQALVAGQITPVPSQIVNAEKTAGAGASADQTGQPAPGPSSPAAGVPGTTAATSTGITGMVAPSPDASSSGGQGTPPPAGQAAPEVRQPGSDAFVPSEAAKEPSRETLLAKAVEPERKKVRIYPGVLDRFKEYKGERTPEALVALFNSRDNRVHQDPPIVLSDGKSTVKVVVELNSHGENNNFLLDKVSLVSLKNKEKDLWVVELLPDSRTCEATISIPRNHQWNVMPLTVAPPLDVDIGRSPGGLTNADFALYLKDKGTVKSPRFDLNGDGRRDYIDDYIFTANYIARRGYATQGPKAQK